jgi:hypothetical protein
MPSNFAPPNYYSNIHTPSRMTPARRTPETQMDSFRFPRTSDLDSSISHRHSESSSQWSDSARSDASAGYPSAAGSIGMPTFTPLNVVLSSEACGRMWDAERDSASSLRRRHSDSCFHNQRWRFLAFADVQLHGEGRGGHLPTSLLHPYVSFSLHESMSF